MSKLILTITVTCFFPQLRLDMSILVTYPSESHTYSSKSLAIGSKFAKLSFYLRGFGNQVTQHRKCWLSVLLSKCLTLIELSLDKTIGGESSHAF